MTWSITKGTTTVNIPGYPNTIQLTPSKTIKSIPVPTMLPFMYEFGAKPRTLVLKGVISEQGKTAETLYNNYLSKLKDWVEEHGLVTLDLENSRYDGSYYFVKMKLQESPKMYDTFEFEMEFWYKGYGD